MLAGRWKVLPLILILLLSGCDASRSTDDVPTVAIFNLLSHPILDESVAGIKEGLASEGFGEGEVNLLEINANGEMDKLPALAAEVLAADPDLIIPVSTPVAQTVFNQAPDTQQIVFSTVTNPSDIGIDGAPANMTGVSDAVNYRANLEVIEALVGDSAVIGIIYNPGEANSVFGVERIRELVGSRGFTIREVAVSRSDEVADAARGIAGAVDVIYVGSDNTVVSGIGGLLSAAAESGTPVVASDVGSVREGAPIAVSVDYRRLGRRAGQLAAEVLRTGRPAGEFEVVRFLGDQLVVNVEGADRLGMAIPDTLLSRANRVN